MQMHFVRAAQRQAQVVFQRFARLLGGGVLGMIARPRGATGAPRRRRGLARPQQQGFGVLAIRRKLADANAGRQGKTLAVNFQFNAHPLQHPAGGVAGAVVNMLAENGELVLAQVSHLIMPRMRQQALAQLRQQTLGQGCAMAQAQRGKMIQAQAQQRKRLACGQPRRQQHRQISRGVRRVARLRRLLNGVARLTMQPMLQASGQFIRAGAALPIGRAGAQAGHGGRQARQAGLGLGEFAFQ